MGGDIETIKVDISGVLGKLLEQSSLKKEKTYHENSLQKIAFQGVERYVII